MVQQRRISWLGFVAAALLCRVVLADAYDPPAAYYILATGIGATLKQQLNDIIDDHTTRSYDAIRSDLQVTDDATPDNPSDRMVRMLYNDGGALNLAGLTGPPAGWDSGNTWNREHSWPQSRGVTTDSPPDGTDLHHMFPSIPLDNSTRGNLNFGGTFGGPGSPHNAGIVNDGGTKYYPGDVDAGRVARAQFYMAVRYDGADSGTTNLELAVGNPADNGTTLGDLNRLIEWHFAVPPDTFERRRNQVIYSNYQSNRNPFIDRPEYMWSVFVDNANDSQLSIAGGTLNADGSSTRNVDLGRVFTGASVPAAQALTLNKGGSNGTYFEVTTSGAATSSLSSRYNAMRTNGPDSKAISVGLSTSTAAAGLKSGSVTINNLDITTGGGSGHGAQDENDTFNISLTVLDHATPSFALPAVSNTITLNFGNVALGSTPSSQSFNIYNLVSTAGYTANMDFDSITPSGNPSAFSTDLAASLGASFLAAGLGHTFNASLVASTVGTFSASYQLNFSDENIAGAINKSITLNLMGTTRLAGDYNGDLIVDTADYAIWRQSVGQSVANYSKADGDGSGMIDEADFNVWRSNFGQTASASGATQASVPEPAGFVLAIGALALIAARLRLRERFR